MIVAVMTSSNSKTDGHFLIHSAFATPTIKMYTTAVKAFSPWCMEHPTDAHTTRQLDELVTRYLHHLYRQRGQRNGRAAAENVQRTRHVFPSRTASPAVFDVGAEGADATAPVGAAAAHHVAPHLRCGTSPG